MAMGTASRDGWRGGRVDVLLASMAGGTYVLILLGIYTAAIGAGLTCDGRWPLCDGAVFGLFPANWPSFVEWFHRLVAMVTGFLILGGWIALWRGDTSRRAFAAVTAAVVLLPAQIWLGAETVWGYEIITLTAHFLTALVIFGGILLGVTWHWELQRHVPRLTGRLFGASLALMVPLVALTPQFMFVHTGEVQVLYYGIGLVVFVCMLLIAVGAVDLRLRGLGGLGVGLISLQLLAGRLVRTGTMEALDWGAGAVLVMVLLGGLVLARRDTPQ